jgi:uroporphyrin-III C-methyltransferase/precorrin-2 dehydrogenase/sirohydrochlorin ferrochelatase
MYPVMLNLKDRACLLVGAGPIAHRKLVGLLEEGARVTVVAPTAIEAITQLAAGGTVRWHARPFRAADLAGCQLVFVATGRPAVDRQVADAARRARVLLNVADVPDLCDFHLPSRLRRGELQLALGSAGAAPFAVRRLRQLLETKFGPEWSEWMQAARRFRQRVREQRLAPAAANAAFDRFVAGTIDQATLSVRLPGPAEEATWLLGDPGPGRPSGHLALVGAGPGDPGLLTLRGLQLLRRADVIVYDRLAIPALPLDLPDSIELIGVGKEAGHHPVPQEEINRILARLAREGKRVVRLKGGDPFVFARGGEEVKELGRQGITCEVVPGVTAGIAAPAVAGIPVTLRGAAASLTFVTAHQGGIEQVRWDLLAQDPQRTLVGYMGTSSLGAVRDALLAAGMSGDTPAAVIERATLAGQRSLLARLADLPEEASKTGIEPPAIFVIGRVVAEARSPSPPRPLQGLRAAVFVPICPVAAALRTAGAEILAVPRPLTRAARLVLGSAPLDAWLVRSHDELTTLAAYAAGLANEAASRPSQSEMQIWCSHPSLAATARTLAGQVTVIDGSDVAAIVKRTLGGSFKSPAKSAAGQSPPALTRLKRTLGGSSSAPAKSAAGQSPPALTRLKRTLGGSSPAPAKSAAGQSPPALTRLKRTLRGSSSPPAKSAAGQSPPALTRATWQSRRRESRAPRKP